MRHINLSFFDRFLADFQRLEIHFYGLRSDPSLCLSHHHFCWFHLVISSSSTIIRTVSQFNKECTLIAIHCHVFFHFSKQINNAVGHPLATTDDRRENSFDFHLTKEERLVRMFSTASPLSDLSEQLLDYRRRHEHLIPHEQYQQLSALLHQSKESLNATRRSQEELLQQLDKVDRALMQLNQLLRKNSEEKLNLESDSTTKKDQIDHRAQLMMLNAEALECRAVAIQLQQQAKLILSKANDMESALPQPATGSKSLPSAGDDNTKRSDSKEINGLAGEQVHSRMAKEKQIPTPIVSPKVALNEHEYNHWPTRE